MLSFARLAHHFVSFQGNAKKDAGVFASKSMHSFARGLLSTERVYHIYPALGLLLADGAPTVGRGKTF